MVVVESNCASFLADLSQVPCRLIGRQLGEHFIPESSQNALPSHSKLPPKVFLQGLNSKLAYIQTFTITSEPAMLWYLHVLAQSSLLELLCKTSAELLLCDRQRKAEEQRLQGSVVPCCTGLPSDSLHWRWNLAAGCWSRGHLTSAHISAMGCPLSSTSDAAHLLRYNQCWLRFQAFMQVSRPLYTSRGAGFKDLSKLTCCSLQGRTRDNIQRMSCTIKLQASPTTTKSSASVGLVYSLPVLMAGFPKISPTCFFFHQIPPVAVRLLAL